MREFRETIKRMAVKVLHPRGIAKRFNGIDSFRIYFPCRYELGGTAVDTDYESTQYLRFVAYASSTSCFLDVGAHFGLYSLAAASRGASCVAFEPTPRSADYLRENVRLNHFDRRIRLERVAISDTVGSTTLWVAGSLSGNSFRRDAVASERPPRAVTVPTTTLDAYCTRHQLAPTLIKIDVEGAEIEVLLGMKDILTRFRPTVFLSLHPRQLRSFGHSLEQVYGILDSLGLKYEFLTERELVVPGGT